MRIKELDKFNPEAEILVTINDESTGGSEMFNLSKCRTVKWVGEKVSDESVEFIFMRIRPFVG